MTTPGPEHSFPQWDGTSAGLEKILSGVSLSPAHQRAFRDHLRLSQYGAHPPEAVEGERLPYPFTAEDLEQARKRFLERNTQ